MYSLNKREVSSERRLWSFDITVLGRFTETGVSALVWFIESLSLFVNSVSPKVLMGVKAISKDDLKSRTCPLI